MKPWRKIPFKKPSNLQPFQPPTSNLQVFQPPTSNRNRNFSAIATASLDVAGRKPPKRDFKVQLNHPSGKKREGKVGL